MRHFYYHKKDIFYSYSEFTIILLELKYVIHYTKIYFLQYFCQVSQSAVDMHGTPIPSPTI